MNLQQLIQSDVLASQYFVEAKDNECAERCNEIVQASHQSTEQLTERGLYKNLGPLVAETILQKLNAYANAGAEYSLVIKRFLTWMEPRNGGVDFGDPALLNLCDGLTSGGILTADENAAIKSLSLKKPKYTALQIERLRLNLE